MLDSNPHETLTPSTSENHKMPPREENDKKDSEKQQNRDLNHNGDDLEDSIDRPVGEISTVGSGPDLTNLEDQDAETVALSRLRCTSIRTEEIADREKQKKERREQRQNRCADYPRLAFGSAAFGSETMMK